MSSHLHFLMERLDEMLRIGASQTAIIHEMEQHLIIPPFNSFPSYVAFLKARLTTSACQKSWTKPTLFARCLTCQKSPWTAICLDCFVKGDHANHAAFLHRSRNGVCDCGRCMAITREGCCAQHRELESDQGYMEQLPVDAPEKFVFVFKTVMRLMTEEYQLDESALWEFALSLVKLGDAVRRTAVLACQSDDMIVPLISKTLRSRTRKMELVAGFFGALLNDIVFAHLFSREVLAKAPELLMLMCDVSTPGFGVNNQVYSLVNLIAYAVSDDVLTALIEKNQIQWYCITVDIVQWMFSRITEDASHRMFVRIGGEWVIDILTNIVSRGLMSGDSGRARDFLVTFFDKVSMLDVKFRDCRVFGGKSNDTTGQMQVGATLSSSLLMMIAKMPKMPMIALDLLAKKIKEELPVCQSVLGSGVDVTPFYVLHILAMKDGCLDAVALRDFCNCHSMSPEQLVDTPLKWAVVAALAPYDLFIRNSEGFIGSATSYYYKKNVEFRVVPTFRMIQSVFGVVYNKQRFLSNVATIFGLCDREECDNDAPTTKNIELACLHFILCMIFDKLCVIGDVREVRKMQVMTHLMHMGNADSQSILELVGPAIFYDPEFKSDVRAFAQVVEARTGAYFKLKEGVEWHPIIPFVKLPILLQAMASFTAKNPDTLMSLPEEEDPSGLSLVPALRTNFMFGLIFHFLHSFVHDSTVVSRETLVLVLSVFVRIHALFDDIRSDGTVVAESLAVLIEVMPISIEAKVSYKNTDSINLIQLVEKCGDVGKLVLAKVEGQKQVAIPEAAPDRASARQRAMAMKASVMNNFKQQQRTFAAASETDDEELEDCSVCHGNKPDDIIVYPCTHFKTIIPRLVMEKDGTKGEFRCTTGFFACSHAFHGSCVSGREGSYIRCPICRCRRICLLPKNDSPEADMKGANADASFMTAVFGSHRHEEQLLIESLAGEIIALDARQRRRSDSLDKLLGQDMLYYIFMVIWRFDRDTNTDHKWPEKTHSLIAEVLRSVVGIPDVSEFKSLVNAQSCEAMDAESRYIFLRRASLVQHFMLRLRLSEEQYIDWYEVLSYASVHERYGYDVTTAEIELPRFRVITLPEQFLHFMMPPYNFDVSQTDQLTGVCLFTGRLVSLTRVGRMVGGLRNVTIDGGFTAVIGLTGAEAGCLRIVSDNGDFQLRSPYLDQLGDEDQGITRGEILYLSQDGLDMAHDIILSGEWVDKESGS